MSFGVSTDNWAFGNASWIWDLVFEEITIEELQDATDNSLLEIVADAVDNVVADLLPGNANDLVAFAEAVAERESQTPGGTAGAEPGEPLSTGDMLSGLATLMALSDVLQEATGHEEPAGQPAHGVTVQLAETVRAALPPPAPAPAPPVVAATRPAVVSRPAVAAKPASRHSTIKLQAKWRLAPSCWWQLVARDNPERTGILESEQQRKQLQQALDAEWLNHHRGPEAPR